MSASTIRPQSNPVGMDIWHEFVEKRPFRSREHFPLFDELPPALVEHYAAQDVCFALPITTVERRILEVQSFGETFDKEYLVVHRKGADEPDYWTERSKQGWVKVAKPRAGNQVF